MRDIWSFLLQTLTVSGVAALLLIVKAMLCDKLSPKWQFAVWGVLALALLVPAGWGGRYALVNWPLFVEALRSVLTGEYGALAHVAAPVPLPRFAGLPQTPAEWLYAVYLAGAVFLLARYAVSWFRLRLALRRGFPLTDAGQTRITAVAEQYGLSVCPTVEAPGLASAFICGVLRPVLVLPAGIETDEKVILHELLHLKHHDAAWGLLICLFRCLHWCNPLLWYCADLAGNDLEALCDQQVLERLEGEDRRNYGRILLSMANEKYARAPGTSSMANGGKNIRRRIESIARFKRYPVGMGLVSLCVALVLAAPCLLGIRAEAILPLGPDAAVMASARTTLCTTYAGAFDTYAKAMLTGEIPYRAMCAPLTEQNGLAAAYGQPDKDERWIWNQSGGAGISPDEQSGYQIYNLTQTETNVYEGLLALTLNYPPDGETWDGRVHSRWMAVQPLCAEKEGTRWVIRPLESMRFLQGDKRTFGNVGLPPAVIYEAQSGDFIIRARWQTAVSVDSYETTNNWFGGYSTFNSIPQPGGEFGFWEFHQALSAVYTGKPEEKNLYRELGISGICLWEGEERPSLRGAGAPGSSGGSGCEEWGAASLEADWDGEVFLSGGGSCKEDLIEPPACYAADFYINGEKTAELTLLPVEGGFQ